MDEEASLIKPNAANVVNRNEALQSHQHLELDASSHSSASSFQGQTEHINMGYFIGLMLTVFLGGI